MTQIGPIEVAALACGPRPPRVAIHPTAIVPDWVELGEGVVIHPFAVLGRMPDKSAALGREPSARSVLKIGARTVIGPHAVIYADVEIGADCLIGDGVSIREGCRLGDRCFAGQNTTFNYDCRLKDDVRIHANCHVPGGITIGRGSFFGPGVMGSNDRRLDLVEYRHRTIEPITVGDHVVVGTSASILAGVAIGNGAVIGQGALVVRDVPAGAVLLGHPGRIRETDAIGVDLARIEIMAPSPEEMTSIRESIEKLRR